MLNKKGVDWGSVAKVILVIIALLLLYNVITYGYTTFITESGSKEACKNWVNLQSTEILKEAGSLKSSCVTTEEIIKDKDVKTKNDVYEILASNMYDCWDMYGRGEQDFYSDFDFGSTETYCRICSEIKIDSGLEKSKREINLDEFEIYLTNTHIPGSRETYADFFLNVEDSKIDFGSGEIILDPNKEIYTSFTVYKNSKPNDLDEWIFAGIGCAVGGTIGGVGAGAVSGGLAAIPGAVAGCKWGFLSGSVIGLTSFKGYLFPSITIFESDPAQIRNACDYIYYKPIT